MNTKNTENHFLYTFKHFVSLQILNSQKNNKSSLNKVQFSPLSPPTQCVGNLK